MPIKPLQINDELAKKLPFRQCCKKPENQGLRIGRNDTYLAYSAVTGAEA